MILLIAQVVFYVFDPVVNLAPYIGAYFIIDDFVQVIKAPFEEKAGLKLYVMDDPIKSTLCWAALVLIRNAAASIIRNL